MCVWCKEYLKQLWGKKKKKDYWLSLTCEDMPAQIKENTCITIKYMY